MGDLAGNNAEIHNIYRQLAYKYANNKGGIQAGDTLNTYDQYWVDDAKVDAASKYASEEIEGETVGALAATDTYKMEFAPVNAGTVKITDGANEYTDDGEGNIKNASNVTVGTIDYVTGIITSTTLATTDATIDYTYNNQEPFDK